MSKFLSRREDVEDLVGEEAKLGIKKVTTARVSRNGKGDTTHTTRSAIRQDVSIPEAPFYGSREVHDIDLDEVFSFVNETALFKGQWQFKQGRSKPEDYQALVREKSVLYIANLKSGLRARNCSSRALFMVISRRSHRETI